jgi:hypothetical protein
VAAGAVEVSGPDPEWEGAEEEEKVVVRQWQAVGQELGWGAVKVVGKELGWDAVKAVGQELG